jgi:hypothetical protein
VGKLSEETAITELERNQATIDGLDIEGMLGFAEHLLGNAARLWPEVTPD